MLRWTNRHMQHDTAGVPPNVALNVGGKKPHVKVLLCCSLLQGSGHQALDCDELHLALVVSLYSSRCYDHACRKLRIFLQNLTARLSQSCTHHLLPVCLCCTALQRLTQDMTQIGFSKVWSVLWQTDLAQLCFNSEKTEWKLLKFNCSDVNCVLPF